MKDLSQICAVSVLYIPVETFARIKVIADKLKKTPDRMLEEIIEGTFSEGSRFDFDKYMELIENEPEIDELKYFGILDREEYKVMRFMNGPKLLSEIQEIMPASLGSVRAFIFKLEALGFKIHRQFYKEELEFKFNVDGYKPKI